MPKPVWSEEKVVQAFQAFEERYGRQPTCEDPKVYPELPSHCAVSRWCESWANACVLAGQIGWTRGGYSHCKDEETEALMARVQAGETLADAGASVGITGQALGRRIARYRRSYELERLVLRPGRRSPRAA